MPSRPPAVSRRTLLGGTLGTAALVAAGCDSLDPSPADPTFTPTGAPSSASGATPTAPADEPEATDDTALVAEVLSAIALAHRAARANARAHPALAATLRSFEALHVAHGAELGDLPATTGRVVDATESDGQAQARVDRGEARLQRVLVGAAGSAGSGALAQTFASMAAGIAQLRTTL